MPREAGIAAKRNRGCRAEHLADHGGVAEVGGSFRQQAVLLPPLPPLVRCRPCNTHLMLHSIPIICDGWCWDDQTITQTNKTIRWETLSATWAGSPAETHACRRGLHCTACSRAQPKQTSCSPSCMELYRTYIVWCCSKSVCSKPSGVISTRNNDCTHCPQCQLKTRH